MFLVDYSCTRDWTCSILCKLSELQTKLSLNCGWCLVNLMALTFTFYLFIKLILWTYDFLNTKYLHLNSAGLSYWKTLTMVKTNIYLHLYDYTTGDSVNLYLGTIFGQPEHITCEGQFVLGTICLEQNPTYDFIDLKWNTMVLSLKDLDLPMTNTLQVPRWKKT